jgi:hypothetical protein
MPPNRDLKRRARLTIPAVHDVLWNDWDPIGVHDAGPGDEYDGYVAEVMRLLESGASRDTIMDHLADCESDSMGLPPADRDRLILVADALLALGTPREDT